MLSHAGANNAARQPRHIDLAEENIDGIGCFLEYLYTGDYFPRKLPGQRTLEPDPSVPSVDDDGAQLLRHARAYTLASKFGLPELRTLASGKIHCVNSTAKGEIEYARYVYGHTEAGDKGVRAPVAQFWATRSHVLRSEAEEEFRGLCLEFPQFGYDVLSEFCPGVEWVEEVGECGEREGGCWLTVCSARARRQAQARQQGEDAAAAGQRAQEAEAEPRLRARSTGVRSLWRGSGLRSWGMCIYYWARLRGLLRGLGCGWAREGDLGSASGSARTWGLGLGIRLGPPGEGGGPRRALPGPLAFLFCFCVYNTENWELLAPTWIKTRPSLSLRRFVLVVPVVALCSAPRRGLSRRHLRQTILHLPCRGAIALCPSPSNHAGDGKWISPPVGSILRRRSGFIQAGG